MEPAPRWVARRVERVTTRQRLGPDAQVDDKALIIVPDAPWQTDPFLALSEDWFSTPGFDWHPHRGIETVTTVLDGVLEHGDNLGNAGALQGGDVQWMTAGRGIIHRELAHRDEYAHTLQLWVNLPAARKLTETRYQDLLAGRRPVIRRAGVVIDVISGSLEGVRGPAVNEVALQGVLASLEPGASLDYLLPASHRAFAHVCTGSARVGDRPLVHGQTAWSDPVPGNQSTLSISVGDGDQPARLLIFSGVPIGEPVVFGGPFVMNRPEEIAQAFKDFRSGKFGQIPRMTRVAGG
ncbi:MAG: pirin family protein [Actinomycetota bacterium]|nr:pirin family protein [Actinomycetota bacterium]